MKKTIAIYPFETKLHTLYDPTINFLSKKYNVIYNPQESKGVEYSDKIKRYPLARLLYYKLIRRFLSWGKIQKILFKTPEPVKCDLLFSSSAIPDLNVPYILNLGIVTSLAGFDYSRFNKKKIEDELSSKRCKAIVCWYDVTKKSIEAVLDTSKFKNKIHVIPFSIEGGEKPKKSRNKKKVTLLFMSSLNYPEDFDLKGGVIALESYKKLIEKHDNLEFIIKSAVPSWIKEKYGHLKGIKFLDVRLSEKEKDKLISNADILLEPVAGTNLILECMKCYLPVIAFDLWEIPEMVINRKGGLLVDCSPIFGNRMNFREFVKDNQTNYMKMHSKKTNQNIVNEFAEKTDFLIRDEKLRNKMGIFLNSRLKKGGRYYLPDRNKKILKLVKEAMNTSRQS